MKSGKYIIEAIIFAFAFLLYANTIPHEYALDDKAMITHNEFTQQGISGIWDILSHDTFAGMFGTDTQQLEGGRYRPLSVVSFAIEQEYFNGNPHVSHFINILLYGISLILLFRVLNKLFSNTKVNNKYLNIPLITTLLFAAHPLHTEVVANIKGRDEILAFLFSIAALNSVIKYIGNRKTIHLIYAFLLIFLGSMSKEIAITFILIIPLTIYFFKNASAKQLFTISLPLLAGAFLYLIIRQLVIGDQMGIETNLLMNNPFLYAEASEKYATILYTLGYYIKLILYPHPLTFDYYPYHIEIMSWTNIKVIISLIIHIFLAIVAIKGLRKKTIYSYAILFYGITLSITSNVFFNVGVFMSERFVFISLLGFCLIIAYFLCEKLPALVTNFSNYKKIAFMFLAVVLSLYSYKTISRNTVWKNSLTLFENDVKISYNSAKSNSSYASELYSMAEQASAQGDTVTRNKLLLQAKPYFRRAIEIHPSYAEPLVRLGNAYYIMYNDYKKMFEYYLKTLDYHPLNKDVWNNTIGVLVHNVHEPEYEKNLWREIIKRSPQKWDSYYYLGQLYYNEGPAKADSALHYLRIAHSIHPNSFELLKMMGISYGNKHRFDMARKYLKDATKIKPDAESYRFIGISYGMENNDRKAYEYIKKAINLEPDNELLKQDLKIAKIRLGLE